MLLGALIEASGHENALDLGAGTGVLSLMIAQKNPTILIDAIEIHENGAQECRDNFESSPWSERLKVFQGDYLNFSYQRTYDLIFSNPPYYLNTLPSLNQDKNQAKHSNQNEVTKFLSQINLVLSKKGKFWIIIPYSNFELFCQIAKDHKLFPIEVILIHAKVTHRNKRVITCFQRQKSKTILKKEVIIRNLDNQYSAEYRSLTLDFHWDLF